MRMKKRKAIDSFISSESTSEIPYALRESDDGGKNQNLLTIFLLTFY